MSTGSNEMAAVANAKETKEANKEAMNQQNLWNMMSMAEQKRQYNQNRADLQPYTTAGYSALDEIQALMGQTNIPTRFYTPEEQARKSELEAEIAKYSKLAGVSPAAQTDNGALKAGANVLGSKGNVLGLVGSGLFSRGGKGPDYMAGWQIYGQQKLNKLQKELAGMGRDYTPEEQAQLRRDAQTAALAKFRTDPGYQFALDQGGKMIDRSAVKGGNLYSGRTLMALQDYGQGMADQQYNNYYNRLWNTANMGRGTATGIAGMGTDYANTMSNLYGRASDIASRRIYGDAAAMGQMASTIGANQQEGLNNAVNTVTSLYGMGR